MDHSRRQHQPRKLFDQKPQSVRSNINSRSKCQFFDLCKLFGRCHVNWYLSGRRSATDRRIRYIHRRSTSKAVDRVSLFPIWLKLPLARQLNPLSPCCSVNEWSLVTVGITPGRHVIDLSYRYNVFSADPLPPEWNRGGMPSYLDLNLLFLMRIST